MVDAGAAVAEVTEAGVKAKLREVHSYVISTGHSCDFLRHVEGLLDDISPFFQPLPRRRFGIEAHAGGSATLASFLTTAEFEQFKTNGVVEVVAKDGQKYRVGHSNIYLLNDDGTEARHYCVAPERAGGPNEHLVTAVLWLKADPEQLLAVAGE